MAPRRARIARTGRALAARRGLRLVTRRDLGLGLAGIALFAVGFALGSGRTDAPLPPEIVRVEVTGTPSEAPVLPSTPEVTPDPAPPLPTPEIVIEYRDRLVYVYVYERCVVVGVTATVVSPETVERVMAEEAVLYCPD